MSYYTEIIFGARLKKDTPKNIIDTLRYVANAGTTDSISSDNNIESDDPIVAVDNKLIEDYELWNVICGCSYYFGISEPVHRMWKEDDEWRLSIRANCKNYTGRLEKFVEWIRPYVCQGSGGPEIFAIICGEDSEPVMYGLHGTYTTLKINKEDVKHC